MAGHVLLVYLSLVPCPDQLQVQPMRLRSIALIPFLSLSFNYITNTMLSFLISSY